MHTTTQWPHTLDFPRKYWTVGPATRESFVSVCVGVFL